MFVFVLAWLALACTARDLADRDARAAQGPWWAAKLQKSSLRVLQASKRQGHATVLVNAEAGRVELTGVGELSWSGQVFSTPFED